MSHKQFSPVESARLAETLRSEKLEPPEDGEFDDITALASLLCRTPIAVVMLTKANHQGSKDEAGWQLLESAQPISMGAHALLGREIFEVRDALADVRFSDDPLVISAPNIRFYAAAPLISSTGNTLGLLCVIDHAPHRLNPEQRTALARLGRQAVLLLERRRTELRPEYQPAIQPISQVESNLRESEAKFRALFESAPIAIALQAADGKILETNAAYQQMLGYTHEELRQLGVRRITHPDDVAEGRRLYGELLAGRRDRYQREKRYRHKDGHLVWGQSTASVLRGTGGQTKVIISMVEDITERQAMVEALRESERKLRLIAENTTDVILAFDMRRRLLFVNPAVQQLTGYGVEETSAKAFLEWIHPSDRERMSRLWEELFAGVPYSDVEFRIVTKAGRIKWCSGTWGPFRDLAGNQIGVQGRERDITRRKHLEQQVLEISAMERRRIGHELHDGLGQTITGISYMAKALVGNLEDEGSDQAGLAREVVTLLRGAVGQIRGLAQSLDPVQIEAEGLAAALQRLAADAEKLFGVACTFKCVAQLESANGQLGLTLYRITQESISNAIKHGNARRIEVDLGRRNSQLHLRIRDNGLGFAPETAAGSGMGLRIMQYRASSIQGRLKITSKPGHGTVVECSAPHPAEVVERQDLGVTC